MTFPLQYFTTDYYFFELHEIYQMIFEQRYGRIEGINHGGTREQFLGSDVE